MAQVYVDYKALRTKAEELAALNNQFKTEVGNLQDTEESLAGMWEGAAKDTFRSAFTSDVTQMNNFYNAIGMYVNRLQEIAAYYEKAEAQNVEIASTRNYN